MTDAGPVPIAGPVFTESYWGPIIVVLLYGPPILAVAGALYLLARPTRWRRRTRAAAALAVAPALVVGGAAVAATVKHRRTEAADARAIAFATFRAPGLHQTRADAFAGPEPELHLRYARSGGDLLVSEVAAAGDDVTPPHCELHDGTPFHAWDGPCRAARTPQGRVVALAELQTGVASLVEVREGTLIVAGAYAPATEADLLALADDLRRTAVEDIHWER
jgi:hypothetical protein